MCFDVQQNYACEVLSNKHLSLMKQKLIWYLVWVIDVNIVLYGTNVMIWGEQCWYFSLCVDMCKSMFLYHFNMSSLQHDRKEIYSFRILMMDYFSYMKHNIN